MIVIYAHVNLLKSQLVRNMCAMLNPTSEYIPKSLAVKKKTSILYNLFTLVPIRWEEGKAISMDLFDICKPKLV